MARSRSLQVDEIDIPSLGQVGGGAKAECVRIGFKDVNL